MAQPGPRTGGLLRPVGPLPPRVYWTRRLVPLAVVLILVVAVAVSCSGGSKHPATVTTTTPRPSASPTASRAAGTCSTDQLTVTASTDAVRYPPGVEPRLRVTVHNRGSAPCRFVDAPSARVWSIYSGTDRVWSTAGCLTSHLAAERTLAAGGSVVHSMLWDRHRSGARCTASTPALAGTYRLYVTVGTQRSAGAVFHLTS